MKNGTFELPKARVRDSGQVIITVEVSSNPRLTGQARITLNITEPCQCHGHAFKCDANDVCLNCMDNTEGRQCDRCKTGYFGNAKNGTGTDCKECQCPGGLSSDK